MRKLVFAVLAIVATMSCANAGNRSSSADQKKSEDNKANVVVLSESEYKSKVEDFSTEEWKFIGKKPVVVDFYADWCPPCRKLAPVMEEVAAEFKGKVEFYKINVDNAKAVAAAYGISSIPTVLFIPVDGEPVRTLGFMSKEDFAAKVKENCLKK